MDETKAHEFGNYLQEQRQAAGVGVRELATAVGVNPTQIVRLEQGKVGSPKADVLGRIADVLRLPVADLLAMAGYPTSRTLPNLRPYMRAKYRDLPTEAVDEIEALVSQLRRRHGMTGPTDGEDETEPSEPWREGTQGAIPLRRPK
jgi:transcriptional regulator with XRE-family HTH domain